ncbi:hypothetical protein NDU88_001834 [Pleurodeles waltl]|uniref:Uncharacterized protein n=1 Tax=Pleurodeles waltl TaxID=8319 RepID=A0AAV7MM30_PLEWA|nr:hypothetical protein NDU88_001834 [Pleurodeles waltl]
MAADKGSKATKNRRWDSGKPCRVPQGIVTGFEGNHPQRIDIKDSVQTSTVSNQCLANMDQFGIKTNVAKLKIMSLELKMKSIKVHSTCLLSVTKPGHGSGVSSKNNYYESEPEERWHETPTAADEDIPGQVQACHVGYLGLLWLEALGTQEVACRGPAPDNLCLPRMATTSSTHLWALGWGGTMICAARPLPHGCSNPGSWLM